MKNVQFILPALLLSLVLMPQDGRCAMENHIPKYGGIAYKRPIIATPPGWVENEGAGQRIRGIAFMLGGKFSANTKAIIYARAIPRDKTFKTLPAFIQDDIAKFRQKSTEGKVQKMDGIIGRTRVIPTYAFSAVNNSKLFFQTVAYLAEGNYYLTFVLTSPNKQTHDMALPAFKALVTAYK